MAAGEGEVLGGGREDGGGVDGGLGGGEGDGELVDDAEIFVAEVVHGAGDGADVLRVAGADEHDDDAILFGGEHGEILPGGGGG